MTYLPLDQLLAESDFVSVHSAMNAETRHQIGERELLAHEAHGLSDQHGPGTHRRRGGAGPRAGFRKIAGAGLDVFEHEPNVDPPLLRLPNVVLVPHLGSAVVEVREAMANVVTDNILAILNGKKPPNCVNPEIYESAR